MTKEEKDVKSEESQSSTTSSVEQKEQGTDNQGVETQDNQSTDIVSNYKKAMLEEREKRKKLQDQLNQAQSNQSQFKPQDYQNQEDEEDEEDGESRNELEKLKAEQLITRKLVEDPSFRDRVDVVRDYMEKNPGVDVNQADDAVLANFTRQALSNAQPVQPQPVPNQLNTSAVPEAPTTQPKASLDDVIEGKGSTGNPELDNTYRRFANGRPDDYSRVPNAVIRNPNKF